MVIVLCLSAFITRFDSEQSFIEPADLPSGLVRRTESHRRTVDSAANGRLSESIRVQPPLVARLRWTPMDESILVALCYLFDIQFRPNLANFLRA